MSGTARRVVRGGAWSYVQVFARASYRYVFAPDARLSNLGLRVVRSASSLA
jgi:formylglycine-generating enzyme required for sulfatase activity